MIRTAVVSFCHGILFVLRAIRKSISSCMHLKRYLVLNRVPWAWRPVLFSVLTDRASLPFSEQGLFCKCRSSYRQIASWGRIPRLARLPVVLSLCSRFLPGAQHQTLVAPVIERWPCAQGRIVSSRGRVSVQKSNRVDLWEGEAFRALLSRTLCCRLGKGRMY